MTNHRNKQNYRFRTWKCRDRCHLKGGVRQDCFLSLILNYPIQYIHFHSLYIMSHYYAKFKENPCVGTDASTPLQVYGYLKEYSAHVKSKSLSSIETACNNSQYTVVRAQVFSYAVVTCQTKPTMKIENTR